MKTTKNYHVTFDEFSANKEHQPCFKRELPLHIKQNSPFKKMQNSILEKMKKGHNEEVIELLTNLDKDFAIKVLSIEHFKPIKWAMFNDEIKLFGIMMDLLDQPTLLKMLNDHGSCSSFTSFLTKYALKDSYDSNNFINGLKVFFKIDVEGCKKTFAKSSTFKNEQINKDFQTAVEEVEAKTQIFTVQFDTEIAQYIQHESDKENNLTVDNLEYNYSQQPQITLSGDVQHTEYYTYNE